MRVEGSGPVIEVSFVYERGSKAAAENTKTARIPQGEGGLLHACAPPRRWATRMCTRAWRRTYHRAPSAPVRVRKRRLWTCLQ
ncbi:bacteriophage capsid portal protein [Microbacterium testaceum StLB037]|uniref:Bacteriophage capsid portal protein n=1 Tax=Microbacterium testaceum (strain StLB037) TaxID=979556 RepID=E8NAB7_MICTS|nr:bacteriophage capsid portal protein [Microbacterium testaceum StLB037]